MTETKRHYASGELVQKLNAAGPRLSRAQYIFYHNEAIKLFYAIVNQAGWIMAAIPATLKLHGTIKFVVVGGSTAPYQISYVENDVFVLQIDERAFYYLLTLSLRIQSMPPLANFIKSVEKEVTKIYTGKYLLDITKDIFFHTSDISDLISEKMHIMVFQAAITYIIGHEMAHISHGHLEFCRSTHFSNFKTDDLDRDLTLRTLEMDADSSATSSVFDVFERAIQLTTSSLDPFETINIMRRRYVLGAYIALIILDTLSNDFEPKRHPISYARFLTTWDVFRRIFASRCPASLNVPDETRLMLVEVFVRLSGNLENLGYPMASNVVMFEQGRDPIVMYNDLGVACGQEHLTPLHSRWARLRPYLEEFQRGGRLAPAQAPPQ